MSLEMDDKSLEQLSQKYPNLNFELARSDDDFTNFNAVQCADDIQIKPFYLSKHEDYNDVKASIISNLDLSHIEVGTKVTVGDFTMKVTIHPDTLAPSGSISFNYKI